MIILSPGSGSVWLIRIEEDGQIFEFDKPAPKTWWGSLVSDNLYAGKLITADE